MKRLLVMRHAKSDYPANLGSDFDRPLNKRGNNDLPRIAQLLGNFGPLPDAVAASPAEAGAYCRVVPLAELVTVLVKIL